MIKSCQVSQYEEILKKAEARAVDYPGHGGMVVLGDDDDDDYDNDNDNNNNGS